MQLLLLLWLRCCGSVLLLLCSSSLPASALLWLRSALLPALRLLDCFSGEPSEQEASDEGDDMDGIDRHGCDAA